MDNIVNKDVFIGVNLGKKFDKSKKNLANVLIRGNYKKVYNDFVDKYKNQFDIRNVVIIFNV